VIFTLKGQSAHRFRVLSRVDSFGQAHQCTLVARHLRPDSGSGVA